MASKASMNSFVASRSPMKHRRSSQVVARYTSQKSATSYKEGDSYLALGVRPGSSKQDIKSAYRRLALQYHPDVCKGEHCEPKFKQINAAYEALQRNVEWKVSYSSNAADDYWTDEEEDEQYKSGWEGAWVF